MQTITQRFMPVAQEGKVDVAVSQTRRFTNPQTNRSIMNGFFSVSPASKVRYSYHPGTNLAVVGEQVPSHDWLHVRSGLTKTKFDEHRMRAFSFASLVDLFRKGGYSRAALQETADFYRQQATPVLSGMGNQMNGILVGLPEPSVSTKRASILPSAASFSIWVPRASNGLRECFGEVHSQEEPPAVKNPTEFNGVFHAAFNRFHGMFNRTSLGSELEGQLNQLNATIEAARQTMRPVINRFQFNPFVGRVISHQTR